MFLYSFNESGLSASFHQILLVQLRRIPYSVFLNFNAPEDVDERLLVRTRAIILGIRILDISLVHEVAVAYLVVPEKKQNKTKQVCTFVKPKQSLFFLLADVQLNNSNVQQ